MHPRAGVASGANFDILLACPEARAFDLDVKRAGQWRQCSCANSKAKRLSCDRVTTTAAHHLNLVTDIGWAFDVTQLGTGT